MAMAEAELRGDIEGLEGPEKSTFSVSFVGNTFANGEILDVEIPQNLPQLKFTPKAGMKYTCICSDPDAISRAQPTYREFIHWCCSDLQFAEDGTMTSEGKTVLAYCGPGPPYGTSLHRYAFLLYEQPEGSDPGSLAGAFEGRGGKRAVLAAKAAGLGDCVGISWFQAEWGPVVDDVHAGIGFMPPPEFQSPKQKGG